MTSINDIISPNVKDRIAWQGALAFNGASEDDRTGRTVQFFLLREGEDLLSAHPFARYTRRRRGHAGTRFHAVFSPVGGGEPIGGEVMLLNWGDGPGGATVKFLLGADDEDHPFMNCTRRSKDGSADTFMGVLLELDDDDEVINQAKRERYEAAQQKLSNVAAMMVKHPHFHAWLNETANFPSLPKVEGNPCGPGGEALFTAEFANEWLKETLGISSKSELDGKNKAAQHKFLKLRAAYNEWLDATKIDRE